MINKLKLLKCLDKEEKEADFCFEKSNDDDKDYYGLSSFELVKSAFARNICLRCQNNLSKEDLESNNYQFWISDKQSFLNLDDYNPDNRTKLEVVFHIEEVLHKTCPKKLYKNPKDTIDTTYEDNKEIIPQEFLKDKEHWIEERADEFILFVKFNGRTYYDSVSKRRAYIFRNDLKMKERIVILTLAKIRLKIIQDRNNDRMFGKEGLEDLLASRKKHND